MNNNNMLPVLFLTTALFAVTVLSVALFNVPSWIVRPVSWAFALGVIGFICGFFGPNLLLADAKPSAGWLGVVAAAYATLFGALSGLMSALFHLGTGQNLAALALASIVVLLVTAYHAAEDFRDATWLVDADVVGCEQVSQYAEKAAMKPPPPVVYRMDFSHPGAQTRIAEMLRTQPGVVLTVRIHQGMWIKERRWRWGKVSQRHGGWETVNKTDQIFADVAGPASGASCERFTLGERRLLAREWEKHGPGPSLKLPAILGLYVLRPVPPGYAHPSM